MVLGAGHDAGGEDARALGFWLGPDLAAQSTHPHGGVVIEHVGSLGRHQGQMVPSRLSHARHRFGQFPLGRGRQGDAQAALPLFQPVEGQAAAVTQLPHHPPHAQIILLDPGLRRRRGRKGLATQAASQHLPLEDLGRHRGLRFHPDRRRGLGLTTQFAFLTAGTEIARLQRRMRHRHSAGAGVGPCPLATVTFALALGLR